MNRGHIEGSSDESVRAERGGIIQIVRNMFGGGTRLQDTLLALSILVNVVMVFMYMHLAQVVDLDRYDDNVFINHDFADVKTQVKSDHDLIQAYGLQKAVKER